MQLLKNVNCKTKKALMIRHFYTRAFLLLFGVFYYVYGTAQKEFLVTVNPNTGVLTKIDSIPDVRWLFQGYKSTLSEFSGLYSFLGMYNTNGPYYLYTIDVETGGVVYAPAMSNAMNLLHIQRDRYSDNIYALFNENSTRSIVKINAETGALTTICEFPDVSTVIRIMPSNMAGKWFVITGIASGDRFLKTIDITTGVELSEVSFPKVQSITYHSQANQFYGVSIHTQPSPLQTIYRLCRIDANTGLATDMAQIPDIATFSSANETLNEVDGTYYLTGSEWNDTAIYLYSLDITNGNILSRVSIPQNGGVLQDNLIHFRYDNTREKLYALFWEGNISEVLPVKLNTFFAAVQQSNVVCNWQTLQEFNTSYFIIERSDNGADFSSVGKVIAKGNNMVHQEYSFFDHQPFTGGKARLYYRLKMVDVDGKYEYSPVRQVNNQRSIDISIYPNPVKDALQIRIESIHAKKLQLHVLTADGRVVIAQSVSVTTGTTYASVNTGTLTKGVYLLRIISPEEPPLVQRFEKQ